MSTESDPRTIEFLDVDAPEEAAADYGSGVTLVVNVASKCGLTPQYEQLDEQLQRTYGERGLRIVGFPCNQFMGQEPGSMDEILDYCATTWGVSFPIADKIRVNGSNAAPLYKALKKTSYHAGVAGPVAWNFEKFVILPSGEVERFRPQDEARRPGDHRAHREGPHRLG